MTYQEAVAYLESLSRFGSKLGLERMQKLAELLGNPQKDLKFLHIAGTNGKGSTVAMLSAILQAAGLQVGTFTSPHLSSFRERIAISNQPIPEEAVSRMVEELKPFADKIPELTKFEFFTALALRYFQEQKPDLVIFEVGMGGRLDATNIIEPVACGITHLALDHTQRLGKTLPEIAREKAGIIKGGRPVVTAPQAPEAMEVLRATAQDKAAPLWEVSAVPGEGEISYQGRAFSIRGTEADFWLKDEKLTKVHLALPGRHQLPNAAVALGLAKITCDEGFVPGDLLQQAIYSGLESARWPGRLEYFQGRPSVILDGAHNPDGARQLANSLAEFFPETKPLLVLGILGDKDLEEMVSLLAPKAGRIIATRPDNPRAADPEKLAELARRYLEAVEVVAEPGEALSSALEAEEELVVVAGSLYLVGELRGKVQTLFS